MLDEKNIGNDSSSLFNGNHFPSYIYIYIHDSQLNRHESVSLASLARQQISKTSIFLISYHSFITIVRRKHLVTPALQAYSLNTAIFCSPSRGNQWKLF